MKNNTISHLNLASSSSIINWNNIIKKEARSITNDAYLGSIQGLYEPFIIVEEKGALNQKKYFIPKDLLVGYDDIAAYFRTEGINSVIITKKEDQEEEALRQNNSTNVIVFDKTSLPVKKAKETAIELNNEVFHPVAKVTAIAAGRIITLLEYAMKFTNSFGLTLKKLVANKQHYGELLSAFGRNLISILKNHSVQDNLTYPYNFLAIKQLITYFRQYVKSKLTE
jgi:hypothetical protein